MANKTNTIRQRTHDRFDKLMDGAENIKESSMEKMTNLKNKAIMMREKMDHRIGKNPEISILIASGIGIIVGSIITIAMMRRR